jgi:hypothetical protein
LRPGREGTRFSRRAVTRRGTAGPDIVSELARPYRPTLFVAVWRIDQAARREDRRRREHPVAVLSSLAPTLRWPPSVALPSVTLLPALPGQFRGARHRTATTLVLGSSLPPIGAPGTRLRPAIARPRAWAADGSARGKGTVRGEASARGKAPVRSRTSLARRNRPAIELVVAELARLNRSWRRHPAGAVLTGAVLIRRNLSSCHRTRRRWPGDEWAWLLRPLPRAGRPGTLLPGIGRSLICRHGAGPALTGKSAALPKKLRLGSPWSMRAANIRFRRVLPSRVRTRWVGPGGVGSWRTRSGTDSRRIRLARRETAARLNPAASPIRGLRSQAPLLPVPRSIRIGADTGRHLPPGRARPCERHAGLRGVRERFTAPVLAGPVRTARPSIGVGLPPPAPPPRKLSHSNDRKQPRDG